jgi:hypothetical protein
MAELEHVQPKPADLLSPEDRARLQAAFNEMGRQFREQWELIVRQLAPIVQPVIDAAVALHRAFEEAGLYDIDPDELGDDEERSDENPSVETFTVAATITPVASDEASAVPGFGAESVTCAHVCGPDPDHACDARAVTRLAYNLPSGGTRSMPICGPCYESETAAKENVDA